MRQTLTSKPEFDVKLNDFNFTVPPDRKFGDLSLTIPFIIGKRIKEKPFMPAGNEPWNVLVAGPQVRLRR